MQIAPSFLSRQVRPGRETRRSQAALGLRLLGASLVLVGTASAQAKPDQVFRLNERTNKMQAFTCTVTSDGLSKVATTRRDGKDQSINSVEIIEIVWGTVPASFSDAATYAKRGDWESAVKNYQQAAGDGDTREPVRAAARLRSIEALLAWGATDSARFADAVSESNRFLADHSDNRRLPLVRAMKARAAWLSGDAVAARDGYRELFNTGKGGADGYRPLGTAEAALAGGYAALAAGDNVGGRELFDLARAAFNAIETESARVAAAAAAGIEVASLGEALTQVASGDAGRARATFETAARNNKTAAGIAAARLGLGHAHLADGNARKAQFEFAWVAGIDHTTGDRRASALVGLAEATLAAGGDNAPAAAKSALDRVRTQYGATPAASKAAELLKSM